MLATSVAGDGASAVDRCGLSHPGDRTGVGELPMMERRGVVWVDIGTQHGPTPPTTLRQASTKHSLQPHLSYRPIAYHQQSGRERKLVRGA